MVRILLVIVCVLMLISCTVVKTLEIDPKSLNYHTGTFQMFTMVSKWDALEVNWDSSGQLASNQCKSWGYRGYQISPNPKITTDQFYNYTRQQWEILHKWYHFECKCRD
jgi:hypothetical protein